jgi:phosphoadenosine phosphosulfate reductase
LGVADSSALQDNEFATAEDDHGLKWLMTWHRAKSQQTKTIISSPDGRGFSTARDPREHLNYQGDIRAVGSYILDQVPLARRCGVSSFEISKPEVLKALKAGEWPEVTKYLQPAFGSIEEIPEGTRPWARRSHRDVAIAAE